jgi:hypothetical protein
MSRCLLCLLSAVAVCGYRVAPTARASPSRPSSERRAPPALMADVEPDDEGEVLGNFEQELNSLQLKNFNEELYAHLGKRPEYETSEMYSALRKRVDVDDPLYSELEKRRAMLSSAPAPSTSQTPGEVIELVLRGLRDVDWPEPGNGVRMLQQYSSPKTILADVGQARADRPEVTQEMLLEYFSSSKYSILLDWVAIQYTRKLELSLDKRRAMQRLRLTSSAGEAVQVTFQLSKQPDARGEEVWLIDQLLVKT